MQERRKFFRHAFAEDARPQVVLWTTNPAVPFTGRMVDLSVGGVAVELDIFAPQPKADSLLWLKFTTPEGTLEFHCQVMNRRSTAGINIYGCRFLPLVSPSANSQREQKLWRYLLKAQRSASQERKPAPAATTFHDWKVPQERTRATFHEGTLPHLDE